MSFLTTGRDRKLNPVVARVFFLRKASEPGRVGCDGSSLDSLDLIAISSGDPGDGGVFERVVAELLFIDHRRLGTLRWAASGKFNSDALALFESGPLSACEPTRLRKLDMVRRKLVFEPKVERLEEVAPFKSCSVAGVAGVGVSGVRLDEEGARGVCWGLLGVFLGGEAAVSTTNVGLEPRAAPCRSDGKAAAVAAL